MSDNEIKEYKDLHTHFALFEDFDPITFDVTVK